ncbi:OmpA family protein [Frigidibacter sp. RF13]|uniref:OmpA family protein n=1 Tax=Frigidibacter sp. RF13 TaxID=2997340 RepID=UPI0022722D51|nr:OmpA family protein [Frigidibacter sp. RF13]MCY1127361.1 OmpA family protein [Frigidibacter sp. RF13]
MLRMFKSSTALVASLSIVVPNGAVFAQESTPDMSPAMICADGSQLPCADGVEPIAAMICADGAALPCAEGVQEIAALVCADGAELPCAEGVEAIPAPVGEPMPEAAVDPAPEAAPDVTPEPAAEPVPEPAPEASPEAAEPAPEAVEPAPEAAEPAPETVEPAPEAVTESPATEEPPAIDEGTSTDPAPAEPVVDPVPAEEQPTAEAPPTATEMPAEQPAAPAQDVPSAEEPVAPEAEAPAAPEGAEAPTADDLEKALSEELNGAEGEPAPEAAAEPVPEAAPDSTAEQAAETPTEPADLPVVNSATADIAEELAAEGNLPSAEVVPELPVQPDAESGEAPVAEAAQILTEAAGGEAAASATAEVPAESVTQITEEEVTEATARSSSEDFANKVNEVAGAAAAANVAQPQVVERKKGLSDTEKLLLLGAGALVVGAILSNNRKVEMNSGDRVIVSRDGQYSVLKDDDALLRQPGAKVRTETFRDGSTRTTVTRTDGTRIVTIRDAEQRVLRRVHIAEDGTETRLIDDLATYEPVVVSTLPKSRPSPIEVTTADEDALRVALATQSDAGRRFSLSQVRNIWEVRSLVPVIDLDTITFETGSAAIRPDQAKALAGLGKLIQAYIRKDPSEVFLIEGHTDAVGGAAYNLALSDRRAESVALALTEYFGVPPENMVVQGYGESFLKVQSQGDERANRRASVRRITSLLR